MAAWFRPEYAASGPVFALDIGNVDVDRVRWPTGNFSADTGDGLDQPFFLLMVRPAIISTWYEGMDFLVGLAGIWGLDYGAGQTVSAMIKALRCPLTAAGLNLDCLLVGNASPGSVCRSIRGHVSSCSVPRFAAHRRRHE